MQRHGKKPNCYNNLQTTNKQKIELKTQTNEHKIIKEKKRLMKAFIVERSTMKKHAQCRIKCNIKSHKNK